MQPAAPDGQEPPAVASWGKEGGEGDGEGRRQGEGRIRERGKVLFLEGIVSGSSSII